MAKKKFDDIESLLASEGIGTGSGSEDTTNIDALLSAEGIGIKPRPQQTAYKPEVGLYEALFPRTHNNTDPESWNDLGGQIKNSALDAASMAGRFVDSRWDEIKHPE